MKHQFFTPKPSLSRRWEHNMHAGICSTIALRTNLRLADPTVAFVGWFWSCSCKTTMMFVLWEHRSRRACAKPTLHWNLNRRTWMKPWAEVSTSFNKFQTCFNSLICCMWRKARASETAPTLRVRERERERERDIEQHEELFLDDDAASQHSPSASLTHFLDATRKSAEELPCNRWLMGSVGSNYCNSSGLKLQRQSCKWIISKLSQNDLYARSPYCPTTQHVSLPGAFSSFSSKLWSGHASQLWSMS